ncbi:tRNA(His) guanylyltransferase 1-like isoform X2 [Salvia hispanica]|uniref:tRNA(His) guanylyltransferase 1-like isoform X2 n=2 Tax=Salvia hispanica TaxID=49212 RepID=UPI0020097C76|nr:tRNA(His) guanylyltransferase 1-like isoform X2 [Salvia hispanica]
MANSKYKYVKSFEVEDRIMLPNTIIIHVRARDFGRFSQVHKFEKPNDEKKALELMNECANAVLAQFPEVIFSYGYGDEYSFIFKKKTEFYNRRGSKILSVIVSFFTSTYVTKWRELFPQKELKYAPSFRARVICCASMEVLQAYLLWRQGECHTNNQYATSLRELIERGNSREEAQATLRGSMFHHGTCTLTTQVKDIEKYKDNGSTVKRSRKKRKREVLTVHSENIASKRFWIEKKCLSEEEVGQFCEELNETRPEYIKSFQSESRLMLSTWIVVCIDGCHFHRFSDVHEFEKPNDAQALNLMNACAVAVVEAFRDVVFAYGVSDEYSFVFNKDSELYQRCASEIVSSVVSIFSSTYTMRWNEFFPQKDMKHLPYFDGRAVCYPSSEIIKDYLAWRQVDCHINNQYNTCFWLLVKSGKSKRGAQKDLKGTETLEKNELLDRLNGVPNYYNTLPPMFRLGSSVFCDKDNEQGATGRTDVVGHCNIIETGFWEALPQILDEKVDRFKAVQKTTGKKGVSYFMNSFEVEHEIMLPNTIIVHVHARDFCRFSEVHKFEKPNDKKALELMNECATAVLEQFPDIIFSYGYSDEYSFIFRKETKFYQRRGSKILSVIVSFFTSTYVTKWRALFPQKELKYAHSFRAQIICCASVEVLQAYLSWRQYECDTNNLYDTCLWQLIKSGKSKKDAQDKLRGSLKQDRNELLYQCFNINYKKDIPEMFRQGTCILKTEVEDIVKDKDDGNPVTPRCTKLLTVRSKNIASKRFWMEKKWLSKEELGQFCEKLNKTRPDQYIESFQYESRLMLSTWIVVRIDGCHFHRFSDVHEFEKPNDARALNLINACAVAVLEEFRDVVFAYGVSDEYSFVLNKDSELYQRRASEIVSSIVSIFSSTYTMRWNEFFPQKETKHLPCFYARAVCYPSSKIVKGYLAWRQVDCNINNQYDTCLWLLVESGMSKSDAQSYLERTEEKNELLDRLTGVPDYYNTLPPMFRLGSSVFWDKDNEGGGRVVVGHCDINETGFWEAHPEILDEKVDRFKAVRTTTGN